MPPQPLYQRQRMETAVLKLEDVLLGVQDEAQRQFFSIPPALPSIEFQDIVIDAQEVTLGSLFVALSDDHDQDVLNYVARCGARAALVRSPSGARVVPDQPYVLVASPGDNGLDEAIPPSFLIIGVDNPLIALHRLAAYHRQKFTPMVIGIAGSVGKTSTKEVVAAILQGRYRTLKNLKSSLHEAMLPITLLHLDAQYDAVVLEMGGSESGDLSRLAAIAQPQIGVVTHVGPPQLARMGHLDLVAQVQRELVMALPANGYALLNIDDGLVRAMAEVSSAKVFFYGLDPAADLWADAIESRGLEGMSFRAHYAGESVFLKVPLLGQHSLHTALAAIAVGLLMGMGWEAIVAGLRDTSAQLRLLAVSGSGGAVLIDDTYNASLASSLAALNLLAELEGRKIAVLGDMLDGSEELGHRLVGRRAAEVADILIAVGQRARWIADEARMAVLPADSVQWVETNQEAITMLQVLIASGDYVLIKGARESAMEEIVAVLQQPLLL